jgi:nucleoside-specific outer membrane channel protein Tsx
MIKHIPGVRFFTAALLAAALAPAATHAAAWSSTNIEYLYGWNYKVGDEEAGTVTLEHASGFGYGDNFFFLDITHPIHDTSKPELLYGQWDPRFSIGKITGANLSAGPVSDVLVTGELGYGASPFGYEREYNYGLGLDLKVPGFAYFAINFWVHDAAGFDGVTYQISPYWGAPFHIGTVGFLFEGFLDYIGEEGKAGVERGVSSANLITQPRFLLDLGSLWKKEGNLFVGTEVSIWMNKFGIEDQNEFAPQAMVKWVF